ncbi:MAG: DUF4350 domain-containing protein [Janthinobacterium lividum]
MTSYFRLYLLGLLALFGAYVALEYYRPKPLDWRPTLSNADKIPYGTYALFDVLPQLLGTEEVASVRLPVFNQLFGEEDPERAAENTAEPDSPEANDSTETVAKPRPSLALPPLPRRPATYLFVNTDFEVSRLEQAALLAFAAAGNDVFIAAERLEKPWLDTLGVQLLDVDSAAVPGLRAPDSVRVHFTAPELAGAAVRLPAGSASGRLALRQGRTGTTLATDVQGRTVLLRLGRGRGHVYLCTVPLAFGNYFVLPPRQRQFALAALSYLPTGRPVWWDEYQKQGRAGEQSVLRVVFSQPSLRTAYYLLWVTALLFILVEARRRQRVIPVLRPLPNTTLLFTRTVASLYRQGRNHQRIADKKTALFLDYLRTRFQEPAPDLGDEAFRERLSQKSGVPRPRLDELVRLINFARTAPTVTDRELLSLSRAMHDFKREAS